MRKNNSNAQVIGGSYANHHAPGPVATITAAQPDSPILRGVTAPFTSDSSLYKVSPLRAGARPLLMGAIPGQAAEPVAWTFTHLGGGRTFFTSLGNPADFKNPSFQQLLCNGVRWAAGLDIPGASSGIF